MDLGRLAAHGRSTTWSAWVTNPVRRVVWWLVAPYFRGAGMEIGRHLATENDTRMRDLAAEIDSRSHAFAASFHDATRANISSQLGGLRKDAVAVAHRLAGLEEEAAITAEARTALSERFNLSVQASDAVSEQVAALQKEVGSDVRTLNDRIDLLVQARDAVSEYVAALQKDVRSDVRALNERIDLWMRGASLAAGGHVSVGQGNLVIAASPGGIYYLVRQQDLIGRLIVDGGEWEPHVRMEIERSTRLDSIAVDVGAYIGVHTITMSRCFQTVHAFEPQRAIFQLLCGNLALNGRLNVDAHNAALYDRAGFMRLSVQERQEVDVPICDGQLDYDQIENAAALSFDLVTNGNGDVAAIRLDDMALENVALIKVDAQGADLRVLRGAEDTIRRCRPTVLFEWERELGAQHGAALDDFHDFFSALNYTVAVVQETTPGRQVDYVARPR